MKLPVWAPRLSRGQRVLRNLLLAAALLAVLWGVKGFPAPTARLAAKWAAAAYGLPAPEVLYTGDWYNGRRTAVLGWDGLLASAECVKEDLSFQRMYSNFYFVTPEEGAALAYTAEWGNPPYRNPTLYIWSNLPEAVRAEAALRLRAVVFTGAFHAEADDSPAERSYDWDETYALTAEVDGRGIFPLAVSPKYMGTAETERDGQPGRAHLRLGEDRALHDLVSLRSGRGDADFAADISVTFYDRAGNALQTWERTLWPQAGLPGAETGERGDRR